MVVSKYCEAAYVKKAVNSVDPIAYARKALKKKKYYLLKKRLYYPTFSLSDRSSAGTTLLHDAICFGDMIGLSIILNHPKTSQLVNERTTSMYESLDPSSPRYSAFVQGKGTLELAGMTVHRIGEAFRNIATILRGGDISKEGKTPLQLAILLTNLTAIKLLLAKRADINAEDGFRNNAILYAEKFIKPDAPNKAEIIQTLKSA
jgi:hypothetical protein